MVQTNCCLTDSLSHEPNTAFVWGKNISIDIKHILYINMDSKIFQLSLLSIWIKCCQYLTSFHFRLLRKIFSRRWHCNNNWPCIIIVKLSKKSISNHYLWEKIVPILNRRVHYESDLSEFKFAYFILNLLCPNSLFHSEFDYFILNLQRPILNLAIP